MPRYKILEKIRKNDRFVSGQDLSENLGISRTAIWKHVVSLRNEGYSIEAAPRKGYKLTKVPDLLLPQELQRSLNTKTVGNKIYYYGVVDSTISIAKEKLLNGADDGSVVIAEKQTGGKGRLGKNWVSSKGGIWMSVVFKPNLDPVEAPKITISASISILKALKDIGIDVQVKWPNDILVNGKKIAGVLLEMNCDLDRIDYVIVSMGINVNNNFSSKQSSLKRSATSVKNEIGKKIKRVPLATRVLTHLENSYSKIFDNHFDEILLDWKEHCVTIDKIIKLKTINEEYTGKAIDVDQYGRLLVLLENGDRKLFSSGETTIVKNT